MSTETVEIDPMVVIATPPSTKAPADRFTGDVWVDSVTAGAGTGTPTLATVRFSPGARTAWHMHAQGQTLLVTHGLGVVQSQDGRTIVMRPGNTVYTPPGTWHWHGAAPHSFMSHLALSVAGAAVEWRSHVVDEEYEAATVNALTAGNTP